jgi:hypothetical protein
MGWAPCRVSHNSKSERPSMPNLDLARLQGQKLFVGTPMYDGRCTSTYAFSIAQLTGLCARIGIDLHFHFLNHEALVTKARDITADEFLRSSYGHLAFIDADIGFDPKDVLHLLALQALDPKAPAYDVIAAPYPLKRLSWERILKAAKAGVADANPDKLARYSSKVAIHPAQGGSFPINAPIEVTKAGTGMMMIRRDTFERLRDDQPWRRYGPGTASESTQTDIDIHAFFETAVDSKHGNLREEMKAFLTRFPQSTSGDILDFLENDIAMGSYGGRHISEDYVFCRRVREAGMKVWLCPWMELDHTGSHVFTSRLADLGAIEAL